MILCGEHAVVYNQPAIAIPILTLFTTTRIFAHPTAPRGEIIIQADAVDIDDDLLNLPVDHPIRQTIELVKMYFSLDALPACEISITSTLPVAAGMGSSASLSVSIIRALSEFIGRPLPVDQVNKVAFEAEKIFHSNPSGVDNTVIAYEKPVYFQRDHSPKFLNIAVPLHFIAANTGISASTSEAVTGVRERWQKNPELYEGLFIQVGKISQQVRHSLTKGDLSKTGKLLSQNHSLLQQMCVSCPELDQLVKVSLDAGALGAKLSGGGLGGNMLALVTPDTADRVEAALTAVGAKTTVRVILPPSLEK